MTLDDRLTPVHLGGSSDAARVRNARGSGARLASEILRAAIALIDETDEPTSLTLRGIARRAGISAPSIYPHFADIQTLIQAVLEQSFSELHATVRSAIDAQDDPAAALLAAGRAYVRFGWDHKARYRLMFAADGYAENAVDTFALVEAALQRCIDGGASTSTNPHLDAWMVWVAMHGVVTLAKPAREGYLRLGPLDRPALLDTIIRRTVQLPER